MFGKSVLATAFLLGFAAPVFASQCPADMRKIDQALQSASLSDEQKTQVNELRARGEELHNSGNHAESVSTLAEAKRILGIE